MSCVLFSLKSSTQLYNHYGIIVEENSVKYVPRTRWFFWHSGFTKFNFGRGSAPVPLGELTTLLQTL